MGNIIDNIRREIISKCESRNNRERYNFDYWEEHVKFVVKYALELANLYGADKEVVELGALLHDVALVEPVGSREDHHINGAELAIEILNRHGYTHKGKIERIKNCVLHHRSSHFSENAEEICVADADILAHFANIPMIFQCVYGRDKKSLNVGREDIVAYLKKDYSELSKHTQKVFKTQYETIMLMLFHKKVF